MITMRDDDDDLLIMTFQNKICSANMAKIRDQIERKSWFAPFLEKTSYYSPVCALILMKYIFLIFRT